LLELSYNAAKNADPSCLVINGGLTGDVVRDVEYFYENGGRRMTDKLNIHLFLPPDEVESLHAFDGAIESIRQNMVRVGDGSKKIWITETGCPGMIDPRSAKPWWIGRNTSELEQAQWLERIYTIARRHPSIEKVFWAFYRDTGSFFQDGVDYFGLVRDDFSPKPAFFRMQALARNGGRQAPVGSD
jgi:hypothetical protein